MLRPHPAPIPAWLLPSSPVSGNFRAISSIGEVFSEHLLCAGMTLGPGRAWASQYRPDPAGGHFFLPCCLCLLPCILHTRRHGDLLEVQSALVAFVPKPVRGSLLLSEKKARFFNPLLEAQLGCLQPTLAGRQNISPGSSFLRSLLQPFQPCFSEVWGSLQSRGLCRWCAHCLEYSFLNRPAGPRTCLLLLHHRCSGKPTPSPLEPCSFVSDPFPRIVMIFYLINVYSIRTLSPQEPGSVSC